MSWKAPIPLTHLKDKNFSYIIYCWMILESNKRKKDNFRHIKNEAIVPNKIAKETSLSRPTIYKKLDYMLDKCEDITSEGEYIHLYKTTPFVLIDTDILRLLVNEVKETPLRFYLTLLKYKTYARNGNLFVSLETILEELNLSKTNRAKTKEYYEVLTERGFISVEHKHVSKVKTKNFYTIYDYKQIMHNRLTLVDTSERPQPQITPTLIPSRPSQAPQRFQPNVVKVRARLDVDVLREEEEMKRKKMQKEVKLIDINSIALDIK